MSRPVQEARTETFGLPETDQHLINKLRNLDPPTTRTHPQGQTMSSDFDFNAPLPQQPDYRSRSWEPAARHYRDLTEQEKQAMKDTHD